MRLIEGIVRPDKVDSIKDAISALHVSGMTVSEARGHGRQKGHTAVYRGQEYDISLLPKAKVEVVVEDQMVEDVVRAIMHAARTGEIGDGRIFVLPVLENYSIRTGMANT
jgi:nitrogen regulatory protein P-II 1